MIRNRFDANNQPSQRPYSDLIRAPTAPTAGNVAGLAGPASINTPSVDMSHLTPEERAMIQSVMAKADSELATNSLLPNAAMNSQQQQLAAMQFAGAPSQINMAGGTQQQREQFQLGQANLNRQLNNLQPQQIQGGQMLGFPTQQLTANTGQPMGQLNPMGPGHGGVGLIRAPIGSAMQNSQPQQSIAFQQQQQPAGISYLAQNASNQQQQPESSASSQLPLLEQRTQQLISQINSQFNLGDASTSASQQQQRLLGPSQPLHQHQQPKPQQQQQQQQPTQQSQSHIQRDMLAPNFSHQNSFMAPTQVQSGQHTQMASMQPNCFQSNQTTVLGQQQVTPNNNQALLPMFGGQNQQNFTSQNPAFQQSAQTNCLANQITAVPNQVPFNGQSFASFDLQNPQTLLGPQPQQQQQPQQLLNQFWYGPPFGFGSSEMTSMPAGQHSFGVPIKGATIDERNNIKFRHDLIGRGGARSDHEDCDDADRPNRLSRRSRAARLSRFKSAETAYELESDLERSCRRRQATARESHGQAAKRVSNRRLPKPGQSVSIAVQRSSKGTTSKARQTFGSSSQSSESLLNDDDDDEEGRSSLSSDAGGKTTTNRSAAKCANNKQEDAQSARKQRDTPDASAKSTRLLSELKLTEQTSQVMEQQQQLIKQSQELIKLQQAQLEQQAKKGTVAEEKAGDSEQESGTNKRQPGSEKHDEEDNSSRLARSSPKATRPVTLGEGEDLRTKDRRTNRKQRASSMETRDNQLYTNSSGDSDRAHHHEGACATERNQSGRGVVKGNQRQQRQSSAPNESSRYNTRWPEQDSLLLDSPTSTTDSDLERLASSASLVRRRQVRRQMTTPTSKGSRRTATRHQLDSTGMTPSPLPVVAAIQLHQLQTLNQRDRNNNQTAANEHGQRARTRTRADLLRSRSVCTSPQGFVGLSRTRPSSPDAMSEFSQRKLLPNPPSNAVPLTPSMVRKMVQTQQVAATSSAKLLTSVNAQSTLLTNAHSLRQPCLDQSPSGGSAGHNMGYHHQYHDPRSSKLAPKPIGSYTAKLSGAQVSFAPDQVLTTAARHQNLSALSRADLSKFLDFTYGTSILKSAPQQQQHNNSSSLADSSYTMANYSPAKNYQPAQLGRQLASAIGGNGSGNNGWTRSYHDAPKRAYGQLNSMKQSNQTNSSRVGSSLFYEQHSGYKHRLGDESSSNRGQNYYGTWRRNSEGENSSSRLSYLRPTLLQPSPKHVNFDSGPSQLSSGAGNYDRQPTSGQFSYSTSQPRSSQYSNTLTTTTRPYLSRSSVNFSSVDRYPARASAVDRYSARENLRDSFSPALDYHHFNRSKTNIAGSADGDNASYRSQWAPRTPWSSSGVDMPYSSRLSTARTMDNERRELATALHLRDRLSYLDEEYGGSLSRWSQRSASTRYPYRQRSFDTS